MQIRWLIRNDLADVLRIENASYSDPWTEDDLRRWLTGRNCIGMVVEQDNRAIGYMVYELERGYLNLQKLAVSPEHRRKGAGKAMIRKLVEKLSQQRRPRLITSVSESSLDAHLFLRACGLRAVGLEKQYGEEDRYVFEYNVKPPNPLFHNRISKYCDSFDN